MVKKFNLIVISIVLSIGLASCSSKQPTESTDAGDVAEMTGEALGDESGAAEGGDAEISSGDELSSEEQLPESGDDFATTEGAEGADDFALEGADDTAGGDDFSAEGDDFALEGEKASTDENLSDLAAQDDAGMGEDLGASETPETETAMTPEPEPLTTPEPEPLATPEPAPMADDLGMTPEEPVEEPKAYVPLRKIADAPWVQNKVVVNGVYLARRGDTLEGIAQKIYGSTDRLNELTQINPTFQKRDVKPGDKVYYSSPSRPDDRASMKVYYEELGLAPETYVVNQPENIRTIAKNLFGEENSWKELWATNLDVESKGELSAGTQLRYWSGTPGGEAPVMAATPPAQALEEPMPADLPPPVEPGTPDATQAAGEPAPEEASVQEPVAQAPPPPPPPAELPPPPPPPPAMAQTESSAPEGGGTTESPIPGIDFENPDQMMAMGAGAILLFAALALFVIIRKRKSRRQLDFHTSTQTQID